MGAISKPIAPSEVALAETADHESATRAALQARVDQAKEAIAETVEQIKDTVGEQIDSVKETVSGVVSMSEHFQREPVAWSLGALSAGFAMGYSLGRAHHAPTKRGRPSPLARLADDVASELAAVGNTLIPAALGDELKAMFGVDLSAALERIADMQTRARRKTPAAPSRKRPRPRPKRRGKRPTTPTTRRRT